MQVLPSCACVSFFLLSELSELSESKPNNQDRDNSLLLFFSSFRTRTNGTAMFFVRSSPIYIELNMDPRCSIPTLDRNYMNTHASYTYVPFFGRIRRCLSLFVCLCTMMLHTTSTRN